MSISTCSTVLSLGDFTTSELPTKKWMKLIRPKMRLCVYAERRTFVSSGMKVDELGVPSPHWRWRDDKRPSFSDEEDFEIQVQRRYLLWYKCIRRTRPMTIDQVRTGDHCALPLYDGQCALEMLEDGIVMGEITFRLWSGASNKDASFQDNSHFAYS